MENNSEGIYMDLNNISPKNNFKINEYVDNFVDGAIIGKIDAANPVLYLSGKTWKAGFSGWFLEVHKISENPGDVSKLKLLRSMYTKSLFSCFNGKLGNSWKFRFERWIFDILTLTEGNDFKKALSRINNTKNAKKKGGRIQNRLLVILKNHDLTMVKASFKKLANSYINFISFFYPFWCGHLSGWNLNP